MARHGAVRASTCAAVALALAGPALFCPALFWPVSASAGSTPVPTAAWVPLAVTLSSDPQTALVRGRYRCTGGSPTKELWVSVKQGPTAAQQSPARPSPAQQPAAWYDLRATEAKAGLSSTCDGAWHPSRVAVDSRVGVLKAGNALVQWCIADRTPYELNAPGFAFNCQAVTVDVR